MLNWSLVLIKYSFSSNLLLTLIAFWVSKHVDMNTEFNFDTENSAQFQLEEMKLSSSVLRLLSRLLIVQRFQLHLGTEAD
jgi:hypothetical protein